MEALLPTFKALENAVTGEIALYVLNNRFDTPLAFWVTSSAKTHSETHQLLKSLKFLDGYLSFSQSWIWAPLKSGYSLSQKVITALY